MFNTIHMIHVKTYLATSPLHGIGLYADQFIPKGTVTWQYDPLFDTSFTEEEINKMTEPARKIFFNYAYLDKDLNKYVLCFDDQRFINHSVKNANIISTPDQDIALRDIQPGEEILCDYNGFDDTHFTRLGITPED